MSYVKNSEGALEITDVNNYYPFGLNHIEGQISKGKLGGYLSYKYNGKELQETGMYDYGARMYMPDLGRWGVVDPLAEMYQPMSTYNYGGNNPIRFIDPNGMNLDTYEMDEKGSLTWRGESDRDIIYTSKNFEGEGEKRKLKENNDGGYDIGEKGYIKKNLHQYKQDGSKYVDFGTNEEKGLDYFNQVADWMREGDIKVEFGIQTIDRESDDKTVVFTSGRPTSASPVYDGDNVKLDGHLHPGVYNPAQVSGPLNPSGFRMSKFPRKENGYTFKVMSKIEGGDREAASVSSPILFPY